MMSPMGSSVAALLSNNVGSKSWLCPIPLIWSCSKIALYFEKKKKEKGGEKREG